MPVSRAYIAPYAVTDSSLYQALSDLANHADALEKALGVCVAASATAPVAAAAAPPAPVSWSVQAGNGHFLVQIADPAMPGVSAPLLHQLETSLDGNFDANGSVNRYTLGVGQITLDLVDPGVTKYFRLRSRQQGSNWNAWRTFSTKIGVTALASGALKTS